MQWFQPQKTIDKELCYVRSANYLAEAIERTLRNARRTQPHTPQALPTPRHPSDCKLTRAFEQTCRLQSRAVNVGVRDPDRGRSRDRDAAKRALQSNETATPPDWGDTSTTCRRADSLPVERAPDQRQRAIDITPSGQALLDTVRGRVRAVEDDLLHSALSTDAATFRDLLARLAAACA